MGQLKKAEHRLSEAMERRSRELAHYLNFLSAEYFSNVWKQQERQDSILFCARYGQAWQREWARRANAVTQD